MLPRKPAPEVVVGMLVYYITHTQVIIDPAVPVPEWGLSALGRKRTASILNRAWVLGLRRIISSAERKAVETAAILAPAAGVTPEIHPDTGEIDRSSTGFLADGTIEAHRGAFFAEPERSIRGWERAVDAQTRIVDAVDRVLQDHSAMQPIAFIGHGTVGTLLKCHIARLPIDIRHDQPAGGGNVLAFTSAERALQFDWTPMEAVTQT